MKKLIYLLIIPLLFTACVDDESVNVYSGDAKVHFSSSSSFVFINGSGFEATVPVYVVGGNGSATVSLSVIEPDDSANPAAEAGVHYSGIPETLSIAAGAYVDTVRFAANFDALNGPFDLRDLQIAISAASGAEIFLNDTITLTLQQYVPLDIDQYVGNFTLSETSDFFGAYADRTVSISLNEAGDGLLIDGLGETTMEDYGIPYSGPVEVALSDNPGNQVATVGSSKVSDQPDGFCGESEDILTADNGGGNFNPATLTINLDYGVVVSCGSYDQLVATLVKQ